MSRNYPEISKHKIPFSVGGQSLQCDSLVGTHVDRGQVSGGGGSILVFRPAPGAPNRVTESPAKTSDSTCATNSTKSK